MREPFVHLFFLTRNFCISRETERRLENIHLPRRRVPTTGTGAEKKMEARKTFFFIIFARRIPLVACSCRDCPRTRLFPLDFACEKFKKGFSSVKKGPLYLSQSREKSQFGMKKG